MALAPVGTPSVEARVLAQGQAQDAALRNPGAGARTKDEARTAAVEFEAVFISQMLQQMWAGVKTDGPFGGGNAEGVYRSLTLEQYGKTIAKAGGIGIADQVYREILKMQEIEP